MDGHEISCLNDINLKYSALETQLEKRLAKINLDEEQFLKETNKAATTDTPKSTTNSFEECTDYESARKRNREIIKSFEITKARLRSRATYSPVQTQLDKLKKLYMDKLRQHSTKNSSISIPTSIKKTYGPTFV